MTEPVRWDLEALRAQGLDRRDPVRFCYLEALQRRMAYQTEAVQQRLRPRWEAAVQDYLAGVNGGAPGRAEGHHTGAHAEPSGTAGSMPLTKMEGAVAAASPVGHGYDGLRHARPGSLDPWSAGHKPETPPSLRRTYGAALAQLNAEWRARERGQGAAALLQEGGTSTPGVAELKSVRGFGEVWSKISADRQVEQALQRGPENAGPLNPHRLMLRSVRLMRTLSPEYLRHFMAQMDALLWLEQSQARAPRGAAKPARAARTTGSPRTPRVSRS